jgi:hypothetical protein
MRRVDGEDLADNQPVEEHTDRSQVLLDGRPGCRTLSRGPIAGFGHL